MKALCVFLGLHFLGASAHADPQGRGAPEDADAAPVVRLVRHDATQEVGPLTFRWTQYAMGSQGADAAASGAGEEGSGGGRAGGGQGGGQGGGPGGGPGGGMLGALIGMVTEPAERDLWYVDRIELEKKVVFQALARRCASPLLADLHYGPGYGGITLDLPESQSWSFVEAGARGVIAVRRDASRDIVGRVRLWIFKDGDGATMHAWNDADGSDEKLFRAVDRERFVAAAPSVRTDALLASGFVVRRAILDGEERYTGVPLHLEANAFQQGPTLPVCEIMVRGAASAEILAEAHAMLDGVRFDLSGPVAPPQEPAPPSTEPPSDPPPAPGGRGGAGNPYQVLQGISEPPDGPYLIDRKYRNTALGLETRAAPPGDWIFTRADDHGFMILRAPSGSINEVGGLSVTVLDGKLDAKQAGAKDGPGWLLERYLAELLPRAGEDKLKPKRVSHGGAKGQQYLLLEQTARGPGPVHLRAVVEGRTRTFVIVALCFGGGTRAEKLMDEAVGWLKAMKISS